jgi:hypothetical protein
MTSQIQEWIRNWSTDLKYRKWKSCELKGKCQAFRIWDLRSEQFSCCKIVTSQFLEPDRCIDGWTTVGIGKIETGVWCKSYNLQGVDSQMTILVQGLKPSNLAIWGRVDILWYPWAIPIAGFPKDKKLDPPARTRMFILICRAMQQ